MYIHKVYVHTHFVSVELGLKSNENVSIPSVLRLIGNVIGQVFKKRISREFRSREPRFRIRELKTLSYIISEVLYNGKLSLRKRIIRVIKSKIRKKLGN